MKIKRVNTKQLAKAIRRNWYEFDCIRQTSTEAILKDLQALGMNKEQIINAFLKRHIMPVIDRMIKE